MITGQIIGTKKLMAKLAALSSGVVKGSDDAVRLVAVEVAEAARDFVAVDTGELKDSIRIERVKRGQWHVIADRSGNSPEVAFFLEYGTARMAARPFLQPAIDIVVDTSAVGLDIRSTGGLLARA